VSVKTLLGQHAWEHTPQGWLEPGGMPWEWQEMVYKLWWQQGMAWAIEAQNKGERDGEKQGKSG
jgi:hypothetical protein